MARLIKNDEIMSQNMSRDLPAHMTNLFLGRKAEVDWLSEHVLRRRSAGPIVVSGLGGIGKTTLLQFFFSEVAGGVEPAWLSLDRSLDAMNEASSFVEALYADRNSPVHVVIDDADALTDVQMLEISHRVFNIKRVRSLVFSMRRGTSLPRGETLVIAPLDKATVLEMMLRRDVGLPENDLAHAVEAAGGIPLAVEILSRLGETHPELSIRDLLDGRLYELAASFREPSTRLITEIRPRLVIAKETVLDELKRQPESLFELPPRKFEEVVAELLAGMGYEVQLTPATRDGGKDILAYLTTPAEKLLCLVEVKKFRRDRTVGVELVRTLYGTFCDHQANSAMLVTTSSFSQDAHTFQRRHAFQLSLHDYGNVASWIQRHKAH